jgi:phosphomannomutase/phosphoglucomutase
LEGKKRFGELILLHLFKSRRPEAALFLLVFSQSLVYIKGIHDLKTNMKIDSKIFRAYDIRGTYPDQLNSEAALLIGKGFGVYLQSNLSLMSPTVAVGKDVRTHSPELHKAFVDGLLSTGCQVTDIGVVPSPSMYFAVTEGKFDAGCNITASHNPKQYNGFKLVTKNAHAVFGEELQKILTIIQAGEFLSGNGQLTSDSFHDVYLERIKSVFRFTRPLRVVIDTGNGVAAPLYPEVIRSLGHEVLELYTEQDGNFPHHEPDPVVEANLADLKQKVMDETADIGIAFDGDGDRVGIVTEKGEFINADQLLMLLSEDVLTRYPGGAIVFTVSNSQSLFDLVQQWGGKPVMCQVGHSYVEQAMTANDAILGGEQSGHFFLPEDYYQYDDALVTACRVLKILSDSDQSISLMFAHYPVLYSEPEIRPYCPDEDKFKVLERVKEYFKEKYPNTTLDGIRMDFGQGGWAGIRVSNTSPCLSITMEAQTPEHLDEIREIVLGHLKTYTEIDL